MAGNETEPSDISINYTFAYLRFHVNVRRQRSGFARSVSERRRVNFKVILEAAICVAVELCCTILRFASNIYLYLNSIMLLYETAILVAMNA